MNNPAPYAADVRAKGWRFELDHERIRQSDTWALAPSDIKPWLLMLWMTAWEQAPCGSLPAADELVAARIGMPMKTFAKHRECLMRGWWLADDGRLYHDTLTERVMELLEYRRKNALRVATHAAKKKSRITNALATGDSQGNNDTGTSTSTSTLNSEPNGSGGKPPMSPDEIIFGYGVPLLVNAGSADKAARSFLGGLRKGHGDLAVVDALRDCLREKPLQPLEWLAAALPPHGAKTTKPNAQEALEAANRAVGERFLAEQEAARASH